MRFLLALLVVCGACRPSGLGFRRGLLGADAAVQRHLQSRTIVGTEIKRGHVRLDVAIASPMILVRATRLDECVFAILETLANERGVVTGTRYGAPLTTPCPVPAADAEILLAFRSGATLELMTDERGQAFVELPVNDVPASVDDIRATVPTYEVVIPQPTMRKPSPAVGPIAATTTIAPTVGTVDKPRTGMALVRDAVIACGGKHGVRGLVHTKLTLAEHAEIKRVRTNHGADFEVCVDTALRGKRLPITRAAGLLEFPYYIR